MYILERLIRGRYPCNLLTNLGFLVVNAAIMDDSNKAVNAPWLIELELPCGN